MASYTKQQCIDDGTIPINNMAEADDVFSKMALDEPVDSFFDLCRPLYSNGVESRSNDLLFLTLAERDTYLA